jgi:hypothetical protein
MGAKEGHAHYRCGIYNDTCHDKKKKACLNRQRMYDNTIVWQIFGQIYYDIFAKHIKHVLYRIKHTWGSRSSSHVEWPHYDNDIPGKHEDDIYGEHVYDYEKHESYSTCLSDPLILQSCCCGKDIDRTIFSTGS